MEAAEVKKLIKELQTATTTGKAEASHSSLDAITILKQLKQNVVATEDLLRETKAGLAIGKLRSHQRKEVADLAKELVKKWKEAVEAGKKAKSTGGTTAPAPIPAADAKPQAKPQPSAAATSKPTPQPISTPAQAPPRKASVSTTPTPTSAAPPPTAAAAPPIPAGGVRTVKTDGVKIESKGDKARDKCIELLYDAMASDSGAPIDQIIKRAYGIEYAVYREFEGVSKEYSTKMRRLFNNLKDKKNPGLRAAVVSGDIAVEKFVKMTPEASEMASEERKQQIDDMKQQNVHNALGAGEPEAETDAFQCGRCKNYKTRYRQAQTRSADEPMTTFVTCTVCGNKWKFS